MIVVMVNSVSFLPHQGRYRRAFNEAKTLAEAGHDVTVLAWDRDCASPEHEVVEGVRVERIRSRAGFSRLGPARNLWRFAAFYARLFARLVARPLDAIHCFNPDVIPPAFLVAKMRRKRLVLDLAEPHYYANWPARWARIVRALDRAERWFAGRFDLVLVHNLYQVRKFRGYGIEQVLRVSSVPGSDLVRATLPERIERAGTAGGQGDVVLGRIGSIYEGNAIEELAEAFGRLAARRGDVKLLLAGAVSSNFKPTFERLFRPLAGRVEVTGAFDTTELPDLYARVDVSIQLTPRSAYYRHITPTKFFDSLACGVPVVTSDIGDIRELARRWPCAEIVDETDPASILAGISRLIEDPDLRRRMALAGLALVHDEYNWGNMARRLLGAYEGLARRDGGRKALS